MTENKNPDLRQWIPIYGIYRVVRDEIEGKPSLMNGKNYPIGNVISSIYHGTIIGAGLVFGLEKLLQ